MNSEKRNILRQLQSVLAYHKYSGFGAYPQSEEIKTFLGVSLDAHLHMPDSRDEEGRPSLTREKKPRTPLRHSTIDEIAEEVCNCKSCDLYQQRLAPVPGTGGSRVKLFIVGGWLAGENSDMLESAVFGIEEDSMLERMLKAIELSRKDAFVSNIIKCGINTSVQPKADHINACVSYLHRQIAATSPKIICTMGIVATRALLQISLPLSQLRGKFYQYELEQEKKINVMPTYHPTFLLKNPEMKKATWSDLQMIAKELAK